MSTEPETAIEIVNLSHRYKTHQALTNVSFTVRRQSIHGFVGPNGAGKTTTLKVLTVFEYLDFFGAAYGLTQSKRDGIIADVLALTDMEGRKNDLISGLSRGMQQRVSLARVLVHDPELLLLDEPASGLDPRARIELMEILEELRRLGKTIFISSHILSELATLCDHVTILDRGVVKYTGGMRDLIARSDGAMATYVLTLSAESPATADALAKLPGMQKVSPPLPTEPRYTIIFDRTQLDTNAILKTALAQGAEIVGFAEDVKHLNQAFMDLTDPGVREA
jgi:ABC-2 type transport system ATP-binding protein